MRMPLVSAIALAVGLSASLAQSQNPSMLCPNSSSPAGGTCRAFHYHVQMWRPDINGLQEHFGINSFASTTACEKARESDAKKNQAAIDALRQVDEKSRAAPNRYGPCHCDMTLDRSNQNFLSDELRQRQFRSAAEITIKFRDKLLSEKISAGSEVVRALWTNPTRYQGPIAGPRLVPLAKGTLVEAPRLAVSDLKDTRASSSPAQAAPALELSLVDVPGAGALPSEVAAAPAAPSPQVTTSFPTTPAEPPVLAPAVSEPEPDPAEEEATTSLFISYETAWVQEVLKAGGTIEDDVLKSKVTESSMERLQLLSNLRSVIESGGTRSRIAALARGANEPEGRLRFVEQIFGSEIRSHWAPQDAREIILPSRPEVDSDPIAALRDSTGKFNDAQRRYALYVFLARNSDLSEAQKIWVSELIETSVSRSGGQ